MTEYSLYTQVNFSYLTSVILMQECW